MALKGLILYHGFRPNGIKLYIRQKWQFITCDVSKGLARILKLPIIFEREPVQNGLKLYKMVKNGNFLASNMEVICQNDEHDGSYLRPWT